jgi:hypothetical protein
LLPLLFPRHYQGLCLYGLFLFSPLMRPPSPRSPYISSPCRIITRCSLSQSIGPYSFHAGSPLPSLHLNILYHICYIMLLSNWRLLCSGVWRHAVCYIFSDVPPKVGKYLPHVTALHSRIQQSSIVTAVRISNRACSLIVSLRTLCMLTYISDLRNLICSASNSFFSLHLLLLLLLLFTTFSCSFSHCLSAKCVSAANSVCKCTYILITNFLV